MGLAGDIADKKTPLGSLTEILGAQANTPISVMLNITDDEYEHALRSSSLHG